MVVLLFRVSTACACSADSVLSGEGKIPLQISITTQRDFT